MVEAEMGVMRMMKEVKIGGKTFKDVFSVAVYEEVGVFQYFKPLVMN